MVIRKLGRRLAPIAWRDDLIARQRRALAAAKQRNDKLDQALAEADSRAEALAGKRPSFHLKVHEARRIFHLVRRHSGEDVTAVVGAKDAGYAFAASHGIATPVVLGRHLSAESIDWSCLPDEFVLKSVNGSGGQGVVPLVRHDAGSYRDMLGSERVVTPEDVTAMLAEKVQTRGVSNELLVEQMLRSPYPQWPGLPLDVKIYCFYGKVGMLMLRSSGGSRRNDRIRVRYFDPSGADLGAAMTHREVDPALPAPIRLPELIDAAQRLSAALPTPFVRLDFYEQPDRIVFGEVTAVPGSPQRARADIDELLGRMWEDAEARLRSELNALPALRPRLGTERPDSVGHLDGAGLEDRPAS